MYERQEHTEGCVGQQLQLVWWLASSEISVFATKVYLQTCPLWGTQCLSLEDPCKQPRMWTCDLNVINEVVKNVWIFAYTLHVVVRKQKVKFYVLIFWIYRISKSAYITLASCVGVLVSNIRAAKNYRDERCLGLVHNHQVDFGIMP